MKADFIGVIRAACAIVETAWIESPQREGARHKLRAHLARQQPDALRDLVEWALDGTMRIYEARDVIAAATEG